MSGYENGGQTNTLSDEMLLQLEASHFRHVHVQHQAPRRSRRERRKEFPGELCVITL
jgi:hypothetical protein